MDQSIASPTATSTPIEPQHPDSHYEHLAAALPQWLLNASAGRRAAVADARPHRHAALRNASAGQHAALKKHNAAYWNAQNQIDQRLAHLKDARAFGEPLLREALKKQYGLDLDVNATFLHLYIPQSIPWFPLKSGAARSWTVSLLDAALHNFEAAETTEDAYEADSTFITAPSATGQFDTLGHIKTTLSIPAFTRLCRELDIGARYQAWLEDNLGVSNPVVDAVLQPQIRASHKAALRMALELALIQKDTLSNDAYLSILGLVNGVQGMLLDGKPLLCHDLTMMSAQLTGILLFAPNLELDRSVARVVVYIPEDPEQPLKEYASTSDFMIDLSRKLRSSHYQRFFSRFVAHQDRGYFFADLNNRLTQVTWHPHIVGDPRPSWRESAARHANLQLAATVINGHLWRHLHQRKLDQILNDARTLAVSTASADQKARWALWDSLSNMASNLLQIVAFVALPFVPFLGELMLAYMAYQLLDETFEGIIDWAEDLTQSAFEHLMGVIESLVQVGTFAAGSNIVTGEFRQVLPQQWVQFIDRFTPVKTADGKTRYWNGDLKSYEHSQALPADATPNKLGLHTQAGKTIFPLDGKHFEVTQDASLGQFQIEHPRRAGAYKPKLEHNRNGAWHTELERPLTWDRDTTLQRIGHAVDTLSATEREQVLRISGYHEDALRKMHVNHEPLPPLLADTLKRFKLDKAIRTFIERIGSDHADTYLSADPQTQLQLLTEHLPWPQAKALRLIDGRGDTLWQSSNSLTRDVRVYEVKPSDSDVLNTALRYLDSAEMKTLFEEAFGAPAVSLQARTHALRTRLAEIARDRHVSIFEARYRALELNVDPLAQRLIDTTPGLPASVAEELLMKASGTELQQLEDGVVPARLKELARWAQQQVRAVRARESLELAAQHNTDTARLALHSLPRVPGWSGEIRIDLNRFSFSGEHLERIGQPQAPVSKVLVQLEDGHYQAFNDIGEQLSGAEDFYDCLLRALPDSERKAMQLEIGQGTRLRQTISEHALGYDELQQVLSPHPQRKPRYDSKTMRLPGGADGYPRLNPGTHTLQDRVRELYPALNTAEVEDVVRTLQSHPAGARMELSRLLGEYNRMTDSLRIWINATPHFHPETGARLTPAHYEAAQLNRAMFMDELQRCWRRQTALNDEDTDVGDRGYMFRFTRPIIGELPAIDADFSHVAFLTLEGNEATRGAHEFLRHFTGLRRMEVRNIALNTVPDSVFSMPHLTQLILSNCGITLTAESSASLASLSRMRTLELYKNPLGRVFSVQSMTELDYIDLAETGISSLPPGLLRVPVKTAIFTDDLISDLPAELFDLPGSISKAFDFAGNPLTTVTRDRLKAYFQKTGQDLAVYAPQADLDRITRLYPQLDLEQASDFFYRLPGTLETGRIELARLETEYATLTATLAAWSGDLPAVHPVSGEPFSAEQLMIEHSARDEFKHLLEQGWRRESELDEFNQALEPTHELDLSLALTGELPTLSADFSHISHLYLQSEDGLTSVSDGFLRCFPKLKGLTIREYRLGNIPQSVFHMGELVALSLPECRISLTAETVAALAGMERLDFLDLSGNPLLLTPDVSQMSELSTLMLNDTHISEFPPGLVNLQGLDIANLSDNAIQEIPSDILELPMEIAESINLSGNPISEQSLVLLRAYFKQTGTDFGLEEVIITAEVNASNSDDSETEQ